MPVARLDVAPAARLPGARGGAEDLAGPPVDRAVGLVPPHVLQRLLDDGHAQHDAQRQEGGDGPARARASEPPSSGTWYLSRSARPLQVCPHRRPAAAAVQASLAGAARGAGRRLSLRRPRPRIALLGGLADPLPEALVRELASVRSLRLRL